MTAEEAIHWGWTKALHQGNEEGFIGYWRSLLASGQPGEIETLQRRYDGKYRWFLFRASPWRDESGKIIKWYGTNTDVEDRKRAEEALRTSEHRLRLMVDSIPGLASTMALNGDAGLVNRRVMDYTGKTLEEVKDWPPTIHPGIGNALTNCWRRAMETGDPYDVEERMQRADDAYRWFHARGLPLRDAEGRIVRWYILLTSIDDRKLAEEALRRSEQDLRLIGDSIPGLVCTGTPAAVAEVVNRQLLDYTGKTFEEVVQ